MQELPFLIFILQLQLRSQTKRSDFTELNITKAIIIATHFIYRREKS